MKKIKKNQPQSQKSVNTHDTKNDDIQANNSEYTIEIPEDEIWTYQVEGLRPPHIGKPYKSFKLKVTVIVLSLIVAISLSIYFSVRAVHNDTFDYNALADGTYELVKFSNPGNYTDITVDYAENDSTKPITVIHEYAFNCDNQIRTITIGETVTQIDGKSFYSCYGLTNIFVHENNPNYCDVDGVLYSKDMTEIICYPIDHDQYLREKYGYKEELWPDNELYDEQYIKKIQTYKIPDTVVKIGKLCFNYSNLVDVYLPEGLKTIETMAFFRCTSLVNIYSYSGEKQYLSFPEGLEYIGSDAFSYNQAMNYVYIPNTVTYIGHHAFWDTLYKQDNELRGIVEINLGMDEDTFNSQTHTGAQWRPKYDFMLFKKSVDINYSATRKQ